MRSRSKFEVDSSTISRLFLKAGLGEATNVSPLGAGEFNAVYSADADGKAWAIKIAPAASAVSLTYEQGMMEQEVLFYGLMRNAGIRVPEIFSSDFSREEIPADWFIMERLPGRHLDQLDGETRAAAEKKLAAMAAQLHSVKGEKFGYRQTGLHDDWYSAIHGMVENLIRDCHDRRRATPRGRRLLRYIENHRTVLEKVECRLINFDIWPANILVKGEGESMELAWIDPERCLWGDRIADFVCMDFMSMSLGEKTSVLEAYNDAADEAIRTGDGEEVRLAVMLGYLGLIMEVEKYARYSLFHYGYWRNVSVCRLLFRACFRRLKTPVSV